MKTFHVTNVNEPITSNTPYVGEVAIVSAYFKPKWYKPQTKVLFSWERPGNNVRNYVPIEDGKTYTFQDIVNLLKFHLNKAYKFLTFNNSKVSLKLNKADGIEKVMFCPEIINKFKLPIYQNYITDEPIEGQEILDSNLNITFSSTEIAIFHCLELDDTLNFENGYNSNILAIVPLKTAQIIDGYHFISHEFRNIIWKALDTRSTHYKLSFSATDAKGNILPMYEHAFIVLNK